MGFAVLSHSEHSHYESSLDMINVIEWPLSPPPLPPGPSERLKCWQRSQWHCQARWHEHCESSRADASSWALTLSIFSLLLLLSDCSIVSMAYVNFSFSGCWRYFFSLRISPAFFAFSTSSESIGTQPIPFIQLVKSDLYRFFTTKGKFSFQKESGLGFLWLDDIFIIKNKKKGVGGE